MNKRAQVGSGLAVFAQGLKGRGLRFEGHVKEKVMCAGVCVFYCVFVACVGGCMVAHPSPNLCEGERE